MLRNRFRNDKEEQATWVFWMVACCWKHRSAWRFYLFLQVGAAAQPFFKLFVYILSGWPVGSCWYLDPRSPMNSNLSADFRLRRRMGELAERQDGQSVSAKCCHLAKKSLRLEKWREIQHEKKKTWWVPWVLIVSEILCWGPGMPGGNSDQTSRVASFRHASGVARSVPISGQKTVNSAPGTWSDNCKLFCRTCQKLALCLQSYIWR